MIKKGLLTCLFRGEVMIALEAFIVLCMAGDEA